MLAAGASVARLEALTPGDGGGSPAKPQVSLGPTGLLGRAVVEDPTRAGVRDAINR